MPDVSLRSIEPLIAIVLSTGYAVALPLSLPSSGRPPWTGPLVATQAAFLGRPTAARTPQARTVFVCDLEMGGTQKRWGAHKTRPGGSFARRFARRPQEEGNIGIRNCEASVRKLAQARGCNSRADRDQGERRSRPEQARLSECSRSQKAAQPAARFVFACGYSDFTGCGARRGCLGAKGGW